MTVSHQEFATWMLLRVSFRNNGRERRVRAIGDNSELSPIIFSGNFLTRFFVPPSRSDFGTDAAFEEEKRKWRSHVPRGSDSSLILSIAHEAFVRDGYKTWQAAYMVFEALKTVACLPGECKKWCAKRGIHLTATKFRIGVSSRGRRTRRKKSGFTPIDRRVNTLLAEVSRFKRQHKEFGRLYDAWFGAFRDDFCRDADWYVEQERRCTLEVECIEEYLHAAESGRPPNPPWDIPVDVWERIKTANMCPTVTELAMRVVNLASLYHIQSKYSDAETCYCRAMELYRSASIAPQLHQVVLPWIDAQIVNCRKGQQPDPSPSIDLRREPTPLVNKVTVSPDVPKLTDASPS